MSLKNIKIQDSYSGKNDRINNFYRPCLENSKFYDRAAGYFSSSVLNLINESIKKFVSSGGKIRLICSPNLSENDIEQIDQGYKMRTVIENSLLRDIKKNLDSDIGSTAVDFLSCLISKNVLDIKLAFVKNSKGIYHPKIGIFTDSDGSTISFHGSNNETANGWNEHGNYESFEVFKSWIDENDKKRTTRHKHEFESTWDDHKDNLTVVEFPSSVKEELLKLQEEKDLGKILEKYKILLAKINVQHPSSKNLEFCPRPHQKRSLTQWESNNYQGILEHATGSGKTKTAIMAISKWFELQKGAILVLVPSKLLLKQWNDEILQHSPDIQILLAGAGHNEWKSNNLLSSFSTKGLQGKNLIIATIQTAKTTEFIKKLNFGMHLLVICDEVHSSGSNENRSVFQIEKGGSLGLSATPKRFMDEEGTNSILKYFDGIIDKYSLEDAINDGHLCKYFYYPKQIALNDSESEEWDSITKKIKQLAAILGNSTTNIHGSIESIKTLNIKRKRIIKSASAKTYLPAKILESNYSSAQKQRWIIYCDNMTQLEKVKEDLKSKKFDCMEYHSSIKEDTQKEILDRLETLGGILLAIKCLDEGVDIPSLSHAIILASSLNPREFIQRRGRVLRTSPSTGKTFATIFDALVVPENLTSDENSQQSIARGEIARSIQFSKSSINQSDHESLLDISDQIGFDYTKLIEEDSEEDSDIEEPLGY